MARWEKVVPVGPAAGSDRLIGLVARLNAHVRNPALGLPLGKVFGHKLFDHTFTLQVVLRDFRVEKKGSDL